MSDPVCCGQTSVGSGRVEMLPAALCCVLVLLVLQGTAAVLPAGNYLAARFLPDGERHVLVQYKGVYAKETAMEVPIDGATRGLHTWQVTDGKRYIQTLFTAQDQLKNCETINSPSRREKFISSFEEEFQVIRKERLSSLASFNGSVDQDLAGGNIVFRNLTTLPARYKRVMSFRTMRRDCQRYFQDLKKSVDGRNWENTNITSGNAGIRVRRDSGIIFPGTKWCGDGSEALSRPQIGHNSGADRCCRHHDYCPVIIQGFTEKYELFNYSFFTLSHCNCDLRHRRDVADLFRVPGTKWCGKGYTATTYNSLGGHSSADRCCRYHDMRCPYFIGSLQEMYGLFNWGISTLNHCKCDERFHTCLKMTDSGPANMIGKIFFNVVRTKCFILKKEKKCASRNWWGNECKKFKVVKQAYLKEPLAY